jgi:hypothetical protein
LGRSVDVPCNCRNAARQFQRPTSVKIRFALSLIVLVASAAAALAGSTVNPNVPSDKGVLTSAPVRGNFQAARSDINNILGVFAGTVPPTAPTNLQSWADTSAPPNYVFKYWNQRNAAWIPYATLNINTNVVTNWNTVGSTPIVGGALNGILYNANGFLGNTAALTNNQVLVGVTGAAPLPTVPSTWFDSAWCNTIGNGVIRNVAAWKCSPTFPADVTWWGAVADNGTTDNGPLLRAAYDAVAAAGRGTLFIPPSNNYFGVSTCRNNAVFDGSSITAPNGNKSVSIIGGGWNAKPFATPQGSWLLPNSDFPSNCSWIRLAGTDAVTGTVFRDFGIGEFGGVYGTPKGLHGIFVDEVSNPNFYVNNLNVDHLFIANMATGYSIRSAGVPNFAGAITNSIIQNSSLMNISAPFFGDGNRIDGNTLGGNATIDSRNVGIQLSNCDGCTSTIISKNNILNFNGKVVVDGCIKCVIRDNELEQQFGTHNANGAVIDLNGSVSLVENATVTGNSISQNAQDANYKPIAIGNARNTAVYDNRIVLASTVPYDYVSINVLLSQGTHVGINRCAYNGGGTTDFDCTISLPLDVRGRQDMASGFVLAGTGSNTVVKTTGTGNGTLLIPTPTSPPLDTFALLGATQTFTNKTISAPTIVSPLLTNPTFGGTVSGAGTIPNGVLANSATTVNGQTCSLGSTCTVTAAAAGVTVGATTVTGGSTATNDLFFNNASVLGRIAAANSSVLVTNGSGVPAWATTLPAFTLGGAINGAGNQIYDVIIGTSAPHAGTFTTLIGTGGTHDGLTSLGIRSTGAAFDLKMASAEALTANHTLTLSLGNADRTLTLGGNATLNGGTHSGTNTGDQTITISGDVSGSGTGPITALIGATKVTSAMLNADVFSTAHSWAGIQTLATPIINGLPTGTGVATTNTASTLVARDASGNIAAGAGNFTGLTMAAGSAAFQAGPGAASGTLTSIVINGGATGGSYIAMRNGDVTNTYVGTGLVGGLGVAEYLIQTQSGNGFHIQVNGTSSDKFAITPGGTIQANGVSAVSCAAGTVSAATMVVTNGIVTHC